MAKKIKNVVVKKLEDSYIVYADPKILEKLGTIEGVSSSLRRLHPEGTFRSFFIDPRYNAQSVIDDIIALGDTSVAQHKPRTHELKTWTKYFEETWHFRKLFEIRENDRNFQVGDMLLLREYESSFVHGYYTGREIEAKVTYIMKAQGPIRLKPNSVAMQIAVQKRRCG